MTHWRKQLAGFLGETLQAQKDIVALLERKCELFAKNDPAAVGALAKEEQAAADRLKQCLAEREKLLQYAAAEGLPAQSVEVLAKAIVPYSDDEFFTLLRAVQYESQLLRQHNMANWVVAQRSMLHASQMLEIIATRGRMNSTYTRDHQRNRSTTGGTLVDCRG
jgi:flagellar biosynthesis/type III secretory pathway chaperone